MNCGWPSAWRYATNRASTLSSNSYTTLPAHSIATTLPPRSSPRDLCPTEQDYKSLIDYANAIGLNVTRQYSNRVVLDVKGPSRILKGRFM